MSLKDNEYIGRCVDTTPVHPRKSCCDDQEFYITNKLDDEYTGFCVNCGRILRYAISKIEALDDNYIFDPIKGRMKVGSIVKSTDPTRPTGKYCCKPGSWDAEIIQVNVGTLQFKCNKCGATNLYASPYWLMRRIEFGHLFIDPLTEIEF
jgi:hypothetical protein